MRLRQTICLYHAYLRVQTGLLRPLFLLLPLLLLLSCGKDPAAVPPPPPPPTPAPSAPRPITSVQQPVIQNIAPLTGGFYIAKPSNYDTTTTRYPLILFVHGGGQYGNGSFDLPLLLKDGIAQLADEGRFPGTVQSGGQTFSFLLMTPQFRSYPGPEDIQACIDYAKKTYRVDGQRVYLMGLSIGGVEAVNLAALRPAEIAAVVPMAGIPLDFASNDKCKVLSANKKPMWIFHSEDDPNVHISWAKNFVNHYNSFSPLLPPLLTVWPSGGHDAWSRAIDPKYKEGGMNVYEWMLQFKS